MKLNKGDKEASLVFVVAVIILLLAFSAPTWAQTSVANLAMVCGDATKDGATRETGCSPTRFDYPASSDIVVHCTDPSRCSTRPWWGTGTVKYARFDSLPATALIEICTEPKLAGEAATSCGTNWASLPMLAKSQVATVSTGVPTPAGTSRYVVSWTPPTANTDGTPVCAITGTEIQVSIYPDLSQGRQWINSGTSTKYLVTDAPNMNPLYWRARTLCGQVASDWSTPAVRTEQQYVADTAPSCAPWPIDDDTVATRLYTDFAWRGGAGYWACKQPDGTWRDVGVFGVYKPECLARAFTAAGNADKGAAKAALLAAWTECMDAGAPEDVEFKPLWIALRDKHRPGVTPPPPPIPSFVVKPNAGYTSRPAYSVVNGSRTSTVAGRVGILASPGVATACDCGKFSSGAEPNLYCSVEGRPNVATADPSDTLGASAAICAKAPTTP